MLIAFDETAGRYRFTQNETVGGKRIRKTKLLPIGWDEAKAYQYAEHRLGDHIPWLDSLRKRVLTAEHDPGIVYVIRNDHMRVAKIGMTRNTVHTRIRNLSTAHTGKWQIIDSALFHHVEIVECALHRYFNDRRVEQNREFFRISDETGIAALRACHEVDGISLFDAVNSIGRK